MSTTFTVPAQFPDILRDLNREILRHQPKDIYQFCASYFQKRVMEKERSVLGAGVQLEAIKAGATELQSDPASRVDTDAAGDFPSTNADYLSDSEEENDDDEEEEEQIDKHPAASVPPPVSYNRGRRTSVSAESMAPSTDTAYSRVVIPKTEEQRSRIDTSIRGNFLFRSCDEEQYADVVAAMSEKRVQPGEEVIQQGGVGDFFYVVETGNLDVLVSRNGQPPVKVTDYAAGGSFGELALMYNAPRAATVVATSEGVLWALDRVTFRRMLMENTSRRRRMYEEFLEEVPLLISLEPYERHKIADALESVVFNDGDVVIKQGDVGENFYIIESGEAAVSKTLADGTAVPLPSLKKGDYFGELALLNNEPRKATVTAIGRLKLATLGKKAFVRLLGPIVDILKRNVSTYMDPSK